jgi:hypothetical protein
MSIVSDWRQIRDGYRQSPALFTVSTISTLAFIGILTWLLMLTGHPQSAGSICRRKCMIEAYWFSPHLLGGGITEWLLFLCLWAIPGSVVVALIYAFVTKRGIFKQNSPE